MHTYDGKKFNYTDWSKEIALPASFSKCTHEKLLSIIIRNLLQPNYKQIIETGIKSGHEFAKVLKS